MTHYMHHLKNSTQSPAIIHPFFLHHVLIFVQETSDTIQDTSFLADDDLKLLKGRYFIVGMTYEPTHVT